MAGMEYGGLGSQKKMSSSAFNENLFRQAYPSGIENHFWTIARHRLIKKQIPESWPGIVLDIGCGTGLTVKYLRSAGLDCYGTELARGTKEHSPHIFFDTNALNLPLAFRERVTCILLLDVLEHLFDPEVLLRDCREAFPGLRKIVITLPARQELWSNYDEAYGHYRRYSIPSANKLMQKASIPDFQVRYFFHSLYLLALLQKLFLIRRNTILKAPRFLFVHRWLAKYLEVESKLLSKRIPGSSLLIVAKIK